MKILYYDCFAGISGDMHLGAMIDAGVNPDHLKQELKKLHLSGYTLNICRDKRQNIEGTRVDVIIDGHQGLPHQENEKKRWDEHHNEEDDPPHKHHDGHRNLRDIEEILSKSSLPDDTKKRSGKMFLKLAEAEAKVHGLPIDKVHFHEVGAIDSIVDIVGAAICLEYLKPDRILSSTVELGSGKIRCAHGLIPVPAPATAEILKDIPVRIGSTQHEATTPTGAVILAANVDEFTDHPRFQPVRTAYGIGQRKTELPNVLRIFIAETEETASKIKRPETTASECIMTECNIDDMNPEFYSHIMDTLFSKGAKDVFITPAIMKKTRPGIVLSVLHEKSCEYDISETLLRHTTTLGIRSYTVSRNTLDRETETVMTSLGEVTVKKAWHHGKLIQWKPEFDDCRKLADKHKLSVREVDQIIESELSFKINGN